MNRRKIVRVIVRERWPKPAETSRKHLPLFVDSVGSYRLACSTISPYEPEGQEFESPRARHSNPKWAP